MKRVTILINEQESGQMATSRPRGLLVALVENRLWVKINEDKELIAKCGNWTNDVQR